MEEIDIAKEIKRLEALYKHYKSLYCRVRLLCCPNQRNIAKSNKDYYKNQLFFS